ncbi:hypothetical protein LCM4579_22820 [Ensifer sp. LCM 4579]|nr:hypothetical protein LCM4579_22820 [Ensifer sp. LCM 4579]
MCFSLFGANRCSRDVVDLPDTGLPPANGETGKKRGRRPLPETCRANASNMTFPTIRRPAPAAFIRCIAGEALASSFISR